MKTLRPFDQELAESLFDPFGGSSYGSHYAWAKEVLRVCKPGAHLIAFGGTRTYHRLACAVEDAGWEIRDQLCWMYGSGFPKSLNLEGSHEGYGTALKPAFEPAVLARKPLEGTVAANIAKWGVGALAIDGKKFDYRTNERLLKALELKLFEDQKDTIKLTSLVSNVVDKATQEKIDIVKGRLIKNYGYNESSATDVLQFVASIFARGQTKK